MKRILLIASAIAGMFLTAACQQELYEPETNGTVTYEITLPSQMQTKGSTGYDKYDLYYEVYRQEGETLSLLIDKVAENVTSPVKLPLELLNNQTYKVLFWANKADANDANGNNLYFNTDNLQNVTMKSCFSNDDNRDAFCGVDEIVVDDKALTPKVTLKRPFAQVNIATLVKTEAQLGFNSALSTSKVTFASIPHAFNVLEDEPVEGSSEFIFNAADVPGGKFDNTDYTYAALNYIFVGNEKDLVSLAYEITTASGKVTKTIDNVPVQQNYRTNIVGNLLTSGAQYTITVEPGFVTPNGEYTVIPVQDANGLQEAIENAGQGDEIKLEGDINLNDLIKMTRAAETQPVSLTIPEGKIVTLNLNGYTLRQTVDCAGHSMIVNNGALTLEGEGTVVYTYNGTPDTSYGKGNQAISNFGTLVLDGPRVENATEKMSHALFAIDTREGGIFNVISGEVSCPAAMAIRMGQFGSDANVLNITGGHIYGACAVQVHLPSSSATVNPVMTLNVKGGVLETNDETDNIGIYVLSAGQSAENVSVNVGDEAQIKGSVLVNAAATNTMKNNAVKITGGTITGEVYSYADDQAKADDVISVTGGTFHVEPNYVDEDYKYEEQNGKYVVIVDPVAKIGTTEYNTFEDAFKAAKADDTITLLRDVTLSEELALPAGIIFNGNGKQINGTIYASGDLAFVGHTKVTAFSASYYNRTITIGEGACLEVTGTGRVTLGYGNTFNITGNIDDAKTADKANIQPSLIIPGGISITGGNDAAMNVTNAYVKIGSTASKNSAANGTFSLNFTNAIAEFTSQLTFAEPTNGMNPTFNVNITNSILTTGTKFIAAAPGANITIDNSEVTLSSYFRNSGVWTLRNKSKLTGNTIQFGENGGNDGTTIVDDSEFNITGGSEGRALDGKGTGSIKLLNGAKANIDYLKDMILDIAGGVLTFNKQINCVIQIAEGLTKDYSKNTYYVSSAAGLEKMNQMFADKSAGGDVVLNLIKDIDFTDKTWTSVDSHADSKFEIAEINGNGHTISNLTINGQAMFTRFAGTGYVVVKDITFDNAKVNSTGINVSVLTVQSYQNVLLDNVDVKNSSFTGAYKVAPLIGTVYNEAPTTVTATLKNCDVVNCDVTCKTYDFCTTGMVAFVYESDNDKIEFENCTVEDVRLHAKPNGYALHAAIYSNGDVCYDQVNGVTVTNVTFEKIK